MIANSYCKLYIHFSKMIHQNLINVTEYQTRIIWERNLILIEIYVKRTSLSLCLNINLSHEMRFSNTGCIRSQSFLRFLSAFKNTLKQVLVS